jgi:adenylosuccinate synthase
MGIQHADVIVDLQYGDTGKGKIAHALAKTGDYDLVLRYNGGSNAGHTVYHNGQKIVTHQIPIGVLYGIPSVIGRGCVVNVPALMREIQMLRDIGISTDKLLLVDAGAHLVTEEHLAEENSEQKIGTTRQGIGPAYRDKYARVGTRIGDTEYLYHNDGFRVVSMFDLLHINRYNRRILCEGAQGFGLDIDWGDYPYVTSSHCTAGAVCLNGIPPQKIRKVIGVMKAYETYVGNRADYTNTDDPVFQEIAEVGQEYGATTGRPRQVNWLNLDRVVRVVLR